jgi:hypothetical protein
VTISPALAAHEAAVEISAGMRHRVMLKWLAPDLAMTFALVALFSLFFVFGGARTLFGDTDTAWHILNGETILSTGHLPHADPWSFSKPHQPWIAWEWGADVLMGAVSRAAGLGGIALLYGLAISISIWMWFRLNRAANGNILIAGLFFVPMVSTVSLHWLARPHVLSWLFMLGTVWFCERMPVRLTGRHLLLAALGTALWSNLHASFFFAPLIALIYATGRYLRPLIWDMPAPSMSQPNAMNFIWLALAALAGSFANPNGWRLHQHVVSYLFNSALLDQIAEFQSFDFHQAGAFRVIMALAICFAGAFTALAIRRPERFLLSLLLTVMSLRSTRVLPLAVLLVMPLANGSITAVLSRATGLRTSVRRWLSDALNYGERLQQIGRGCQGLALAPLFALLIFSATHRDAGFSPNTAPVAAASSIAPLPANARILSTDSFGGYLIYRFRGTRKVFFDGRSDYYGSEFIDKYTRLISALPGWRDELNRWHFTHALLPPNCALVPALETIGWQEIYRDHTAVLLAAANETH